MPLSRLHRKFSCLTLFAIAVMMLVSLCLPPVAHALYTVDPTRIELDFNKEHKDMLTTVVSVTNMGSEPVRLKAYLETWAMDESGGLLLNPDNLPYKTILDAQVRFNPKEFELQPGKSQLVRVAVKIPAEIQNAELRGMLFFEDLKTKTQLLSAASGVNASIEIKQRLGLAIYAYKGNIKPHPVLNAFRCNIENGKLVAVMDVENQGDRHYRGSGTLLLSRLDTKSGKPELIREIPVRDANDQVILPLSRLKLEELITSNKSENVLPDGKYRLEFIMLSKVNPELKELNAVTDVEWKAPPVEVKAADTKALPASDKQDKSQNKKQDKNKGAL